VSLINEHSDERIPVSFEAYVLAPDSAPRLGLLRRQERNTFVSAMESLTVVGSRGVSFLS